MSDPRRIERRIARLAREGTRRARRRAGAAAEALASSLPATVTVAVSRGPTTTSVVVAAPGLAARELGTAATPAEPVVGPALDRLRAAPPPES